MKRADEILHEAAQTFAKRNAVYKDNWHQVGQIMAVLFPNGVSLKAPRDFDRWHLFELMVVKLTRFANAGLAHQDSIHDICVYAAMVEMLAIHDEPIQPAAMIDGDSIVYKGTALFNCGNCGRTNDEIDLCERAACPFEERKVVKYDRCSLCFTSACDKAAQCLGKFFSTSEVEALRKAYAK